MAEHSREWGAPVPKYGQERWYYVWGPQGTMASRVIILSDRWYGQWFHWTGREKIPCTMCEGCPQCAYRDPNRWSGYVAALIGNPSKECVWTISANAARSLEGVLEARGTLRGLECEFKRQRATEGRKQRNNAKVVVEIKRTHTPDSIRPAFPVVYSLHRLHGVLSTRREGVQSAPPQVFRPDKLPRFDYRSIPLAE